MDQLFVVQLLRLGLQLIMMLICPTSVMRGPSLPFRQFFTIAVKEVIGQPVGTLITLHIKTSPNSHFVNIAPYIQLISQHVIYLQIRMSFCVHQ